MADETNKLMQYMTPVQPGPVTPEQRTQMMRDAIGEPAVSPLDLIGLGAPMRWGATSVGRGVSRMAADNPHLHPYYLTSGLAHAGVQS